jgi:nicotinamidase/pyrazinamidase
MTTGGAEALMVIDMQNGFTRFGRLSHPRNASVIPRVVELLQEHQESGHCLIFTKDTHVVGDPGINAFGQHCILGTAEHDLVDELQPFAASATVVEKPRYSAFFRTDLERLLAERAPAMVTVVGVAADICVLHTVADLRNRDYRVRVVTDAVETFDSPVHRGAESKKWALEHMAVVLKAELV